MNCKFGCLWMTVIYPPTKPIGGGTASGFVSLEKKKDFPLRYIHLQQLVYLAHTFVAATTSAMSSTDGYICVCMSDLANTALLSNTNISVVHVKGATDFCVQ